MSKKNRAKSKAKRFGEGSAKPIVSAATYGVGGNAFAQAIADPVSTVHSNKPELLVVDGYNVIHCTPRYEKLVYDHSDDPYSSDVHDMARTALINDVAAFAQGRYEAVIVFDGAGNISSERPNLPARGVRIEFSPTGVSADTVVQKLCIEAREEGRACSVVSSDGTIQAVVMGKGVTRISSRMLVDEIKQIDNDVHEAEELMLDVFAYLFTKKPKIRDGGFKAYLYKAARHMALRHKSKRKPLFSLDALADEPDGRLLAEEVIRSEERNRILHFCMDEMNPDYREVLYLTYFEDMSYAQAAEVTGKTVKQITNLVYRGKESLRRLLEREGITNAES